MPRLEQLENIRIFAFLGLAALLFLCELKFSSWTRKTSPQPRRLQNIFIVVFNTVIARLSLGAFPVAVAIYASDRNIGILTIFQNNVAVPVMIVVTYVVLDLAIYMQHVALHNYTWLWPLHAPHHADPDLDFSTGFRFHLFEIIFSLVYKAVVILIFGLNPIGVLIFEIILNGSAMFNHANIKLPDWLENILSKVIVTPSLHRVHHSRVRDEADNNYGFTIVFWDKIFETLIVKDRQQLEVQEIGLPESSDMTNPSLKTILLMPFTEFFRRS